MNTTFNSKKWEQNKITKRWGTEVDIYLMSWGAVKLCSIGDWIRLQRRVCHLYMSSVSSVWL